MVHDPDELLVTEAQKGSREAFGKLVTHYHDMVYGLAYGVLNHREAALDVAQDVFLKVFHEISRFQGKSKFKTWLYRISVNAAIDQQRKIRPSDSIDATDVSDEDGVAPLVLVDLKQDPSESAHQEELKKVVAKALDKLTPEQRAILVLREWQGLSYEEIAEVLAIEIGTVMSRLFYARKRLGEILGEKFKKEIIST